MSISFRNPHCLRCGNDTIYGETEECVECGLDTEVFNMEYGWGDYHNRMKYRYNGGYGMKYWDWQYVPEGCLAVFVWEEL